MNKPDVDSPSTLRAAAAPTLGRAAQPPDTARLMFEMMIDRRPLYNIENLSDQNMEDLYQTAYTLYTSEQYEKALTFFHMLTIYSQFDVRGWVGLGSCFQALKSYYLAIEAYSTATILDPDDILTRFHIVECWMNVGQGEKAIQILKTIIPICESFSDTKAYLDKANSLIQLLSASSAPSEA